MSLDSIVFIQQIRAPSSEIWLADLSRQSQEAFAQIDIHYLADHVEATVCLLKPLKNDEILHKFLNMIDDELIAAGDLVKPDANFCDRRGESEWQREFHAAHRAACGDAPPLSFGSGQ